MRLTFVILLVVGTAAVLVSAQQVTSQRRQARARFRAIAEAARSGDKAAQDLLKSRRRQRPRERTEPTRSSAVPPRPVFEVAVEAPVERKEPVRVRVPVRRTRVRPARPVPEVTTFHPRTILTTTPFPEPVFPDTEESIFPTDAFTESPVFEQISTVPVTQAPRFRNVVQQTPAPTTHRFRQQSRPAVQSRPVDDFNINFELEPHRALNSGLEIGSRSEHIIPRFGNDRTTEPPVETIRRYSYFDEQGNYVFGYEAADGSFKEEIRGLDCVVNGKYGYVDPDGIRREFTYTSGNKCDPNAVVDPETQEVPVLPLNDQFLQQTQEQQLTEDELNQLQFNRRRRPVQTEQPREQTIVSDNRRRRPQSSSRPRPSPQPVQEPQQVFRPAPRRPSPRPVQEPEPVFRPAPRRPSPRPVQEPEPVFRPTTEAPIRVTPAPAPVFTTPASFNRFTTPASLRPRPVQERFPVQQLEVRQPRPVQERFPVQQLEVRQPRPVQERFPVQQQQEVRQPRPVQDRFPVQQQQEVRRPRPQTVFVPEEEQLIRRPQPTRAPVQEQPIRQSTHQAFQPPEGPTLRPTPKPIAFDFDREFNNLFSNFAAPRPATRPPVFTTPRPRPRPTPPPTSRPRSPPPTSRPPPPPPPPTTRATFRPVTTAPVTSHQAFDDGSHTLSGGRDVANQLVFDSATGTFTNVKVKAANPNSFLPRPAPNPFAPRPTAPSPTLPSRPPTPSAFPTSPFTAPISPIPSHPPPTPTVGRPLPPPTQPAAFNPASHFVINQNGRSPAAAEFDKFFSQFNLKF